MERSCQQYVAVKQQLVPPDLFRLRYRAEISAAVKALVQQTLALNDVNSRRSRPASVAVEDRVRFATQLRLEFDTLHSGNAVRFSLRPWSWRPGKTNFGRMALATDPTSHRCRCPWLSRKIPTS